jgi:hypothetical protein
VSEISSLLFEKRNIAQPSTPCGFYRAHQNCTGARLTAWLAGRSKAARTKMAPICKSSYPPILPILTEGKIEPFLNRSLLFKN